MAGHISDNDLHDVAEKVLGKVTVMDLSSCKP